MSVGARPATAVLAIAMLLTGGAGLLSGCAGTEHYTADAAKSLEQQLFAIANASASHSYASALQQLSQLQLADDAAWKEGAITRPRHDAIATAIGQVRADLMLLQTQAQIRTLQQRRATLLNSPVAAPARATAAPAAAPHSHAKHGGGHGGHGGHGKNGG